MEDLQEKLTAYTQQLEQVAELEASDPSNAGFTKLRTDLEEVIRLTTGLLEEAKGTSALPAPEATSSAAAAAAAEGAPPAPPKYEADPIGKWEPVTAPAPASASTSASPDYSRRRDGGGAGAGGGGAGVGKTSGATAVAETSGSAAVTGVFGVGARVEVLSADKWYPAVIDRVSEDGQDFGVTYMGYGTEGTATITTLRRITRSPRPVSATAAVKGLECRALYVGDGTYYDCKIDEVTANGYKVLFTAYGNVEEVPLEYLHKKVKVAEAQADADASFAIPESLRLQEGDSEAERDRKRKKVKALKGRFKMKQKDAVVNNKQASWQAFQTKGAKKKAKGSMSAVSTKKGSIFASPEGLEGKVGVTGSGQGITEQAARKKFKTIK